MRPHRFAAWLAGLSAVGTAFAQTCDTHTLRSAVPAKSSRGVALQSYSYCGGTLNVTVYIANVNYNKIVTLYYTNRQNESTPLSVISLNYQSSIGSDGKWEFWGANTPVYIDGITELLNLTYQATDIGQTYNQLLDIPVEASGKPEPTLPSPPAPYATPQGFANDITNFLAVTKGSEAEIAHQQMFVNINPAVSGAAKGIIVAAQSGPTYPQKDPDYEYNWVRDASLTMDVVETLYSAATNKTAKAQYRDILFQYAKARATEQQDPNLQTGLGEPKFYLNNTIFSGPWGRPQNDGAATAAITLIEFANDYLASGGSMQTVKQQVYDSTKFPNAAPVQKDLLFVAKNWTSASFDLWEEISSDNFYTRMVQRRALIMGSNFATKMGDSSTASTLTTAADALTKTLSQFWDPNREILLYEYGPVLKDKSSYLDTAVILGLIHGYANDGVYSWTNPQVQSTALRIATSFINVYPIANTTHDSSGKILGIPVGRYPEDIYTGTGTAPNGGNPWYLTTAAFSQYMYASLSEYQSAGSIAVTNTSAPFWKYFAPEAQLAVGKTYGRNTNQFKQAITSLAGWGDAFMRTVKFYTPSGGHLAEEIDRKSGVPRGAADLTWSYASVLTAAFARAEARGQMAYVSNLANLGVKAN